MNNSKLLMFIVIFVTLCGLASAAFPYTPLHHYKLDNNGTDDGSNPIGLSEIGAVTYVSGKVNNAANISGDDVLLKNSTYNDPDSIRTISFWFKPSAYCYTNTCYVIQFKKDADDLVYFSTRPDEKLQVIVNRNGGNQVEMYSTTSLQEDVWIHVVVTIGNGSGAALWINGGSSPEATDVDTEVMDNGFGNIEVGRRITTDDLDFDGLVDNIGFFSQVFNETTVSESWNGGSGYDFTEAAAPPPTYNSINISDPLPTTETQYVKSKIDMNATVNSTRTFNATLFLGRDTTAPTVNITLEDIAAGDELTVNFTVDLDNGNWSYYINVTNNETSVQSDSKFFYLDNTDPTITHNFTIDKVFMFDNISGEFTFSDNLYLSSFNVTIESSILDAINLLNDSTYIYNLSQNVSNWGIGNHNVSIRLADGHTAKELGGDYDVKDGIFNSYLQYDFYDGGYVKTELDNPSMFDEWESVKYTDRYKQILEPSNPSSTITLIEESDLPIYIVNKPGHYKDKWLVIGNHWKDYVVKNEPNSKVSITRINSKKVEVTISGLKNPDRIEFESIGDLNIINQNFSFYVTDYFSNTTDTVVENEQQTVVLEINTTDGTNSTNATFYFNHSQISLTKTSYTGYDRYSATFITPTLNTGTTSEIKSLDFNYTIYSIGGIETGNISSKQTVYTLGVDNCTTYSARAFNITLYDEVSSKEINGTIDAYFEVWVDDINNFSRFNLSWDYNTHHAPVGICISPNESNYTSSAQWEYSSPGYETRNYYFVNTVLDNSTNFLNLYLNNDTTQVQFTVNDLNDNAVEGAYIKILRYNLPTDSYVISEVIQTDTNGEAFGQIKLNTQWYQFIIEYQNEVKLETLPTKITSTTKTFRINLDESDYYERYTTTRGIQHSLTFTNSTATFRFTWNDPASEINQACLRIVRRSINADTTINDTCTTSSSGTILGPINENTSKYTYIATSYVIFPDYKEYILDTLSQSYNQLYKQYGQEGIFVSFLFVLVLIMVGIWNPFVAILLALVGVFITILLGVFHLSWPMFIGLVILGGITLYKLNRD